MSRKLKAKPANTLQGWSDIIMEHGAQLGGKGGQTPGAAGEAGQALGGGTPGQGGVGSASAAAQAVIEESLTLFAARKQSAVSVVTRLDGRILCVWNLKHGPGWVLPGGKVEPGEDVAVAQVRELREETSLETLFAAPLYCAMSCVDPERAVYVFAVSALGEPKEAEKGAPVCWLTVDELLEKSPFAEFYTKMFDQIRRDRA